MTKDLKHLSPAALTQALQPWVSARNEDVTIVGKTLGTALANMPHAYGLESMDLRELLSAYVAAVLGKLVPKLLPLHARLVEVAGVGAMYNFEHVDRYAMVHADEPDFKTMAFQTQSMTYMVVLRGTTAYTWTEDEACKGVSTWKLDLRMCTAGRRSLDYARPALDSLTMLQSRSTLKESEYFLYKDARDRGYLCSLKPETFNRTSSEVLFETKDMHWNAALSFLTGVIRDLEAHASMVEEIQPAT